MDMREIINLLEGRVHPNGGDIQDGPGWNEATLDHPDVLYHLTPSANRESILTRGINLDFTDGAGIFFSDKSDSLHSGIDCWAVDVRGIPLERDATTDHHHLGEEWWVTYDLNEIPPDRLKVQTVTELPEN